MANCLANTNCLANCLAITCRNCLHHANSPHPQTVWQTVWQTVCFGNCLLPLARSHQTVWQTVCFRKCLLSLATHPEQFGKLFGKLFASESVCYHSPHTLSSLANCLANYLRCVNKSRSCGSGLLPKGVMTGCAPGAYSSGGDTGKIPHPTAQMHAFKVITTI